jgi:hypothetical protein
MQKLKKINEMIEEERRQEPDRKGLLIKYLEEAQDIILYEADANQQRLDGLEMVNELINIAYDMTFNDGWIKGEIARQEDDGEI